MSLGARAGPLRVCDYRSLTISWVSGFLQALRKGKLSAGSPTAAGGWVLQLQRVAGRGASCVHTGDFNQCQMTGFWGEWGAVRPERETHVRLDRVLSAISMSLDFTLEVIGSHGGV